jgi:DNA-binding MarR family transcriptional regulator
MDEAKAKNYIEEEPDQSDKRKRLIKPGPALLEYVEAEIDRTISASYLDDVATALSPGKTSRQDAAR